MTNTQNNLPMARLSYILSTTFLLGSLLISCTGANPTESALQGDGVGTYGGFRATYVSAPDAVNVYMTVVLSPSTMQEGTICVSSKGVQVAIGNAVVNTYGGTPNGGIYSQTLEIGKEPSLSSVKMTVSKDLSFTTKLESIPGAGKIPPDLSMLDGDKGQCSVGKGPYIRSLWKSLSELEYPEAINGFLNNLKATASDEDYNLAVAAKVLMEKMNPPSTVLSPNEADRIISEARLLLTSLKTGTFLQDLFSSFLIVANRDINALRIVALYNVESK